MKRLIVLTLALLPALATHFVRITRDKKTIRIHLILMKLCFKIAGAFKYNNQSG
ncbi:hypothetical protein SK447_002032 [Enterobacter hormaechei]|nr:hypothetical protein [Enterobacter hormaechei subsp. xiangfangensis]ELX8364134.1 hypothetical protein [Enterobacter hormaechei]